MDTAAPVSHKRSLRRVASPSFPSETLNEAAVRTIAQQGYTDIGITVVLPGSNHNEDWSLAQGERLAQLALSHNLGLLIATGYMKYQERLLGEEPNRAFVACGAGAQVDLDGLSSTWLCPFQPENRRMYCKVLCEIATWPTVREIHLNDEASLGFGSGAIGCYCDYCSRQFRRHADEDPPRDPQWDDPLWWKWLEYRMDSWVQVHAEFRDAIKAIQPKIRVGIQHSPLQACFITRPWQSAISLARDAKALDLLTIDPYHFLHCDLIPYRPHRRIQTESVRALVGACLNRGIGVYPQAFMPPGRSAPLTRQDGLMAGIVPFALGADTVIPYSYEASKLIPGYCEAFAETKQLQQELENSLPYAYVTIIKPHQSELTGHHQSDWGVHYLEELANLMYRTGLPWRWFWDERLLDAAELLTGPLIVPDAHCLTEQQISVIDGLIRKGAGVLWVGNRPAQPWPGRGRCLLPSEFHHGPVELRPCANHDVIDNLTTPIMLCSRVNDDGPAGTVLGTAADYPGLVIQDCANSRQAWLTGLPMHSYAPPDLGGGTRARTGGIALLQKLLEWASPQRPIIKNSPIITDYGRLRPWDVRDLPTAEMLPLICSDGILAVLFPYAACPYETVLTVNIPGGKQIVSVEDIWRGAELTDQLQHDDDRQAHLPLRVSGDCELLAIRFRWA